MSDERNSPGTKKMDRIKRKKAHKNKNDDVSSSTSKAPFSAGSLTYENRIHNLEKLDEIEAIKNNLMTKETEEAKDLFSSAYIAFKKEDTEIPKAYVNKSNMEQEIINNGDLKLNDDLFEINMVKILSKTCELKEYILYPYFRVESSNKKPGNIIKVYYIKISFDCDGNKVNPILFLDDRNNYMTSFEKIPMIFHKNKNDFEYVTVISKDFQSYFNFFFTKYDLTFETSFFYNDISGYLVEIKNEIKKAKNTYDSIQDKEAKEKLEKQLASYDSLSKIYEKKYSNENLPHELERYKNDKDILIEKRKLYELEKKPDENKIKECDEKINSLQKEIDKCEILMKKITIKIEKKDQEFDGLFFTTKEINLTNSIGDKLKIPSNCPVIVEVKNYKRYKSILENIGKKKFLLESLGFNDFYYIGILNGIDINESGKEEIIKNFKYFDSKKVIILYPEKQKFFNIPIYEEEKEKSVEVKEIKKEENITHDLIKMFKDFEEKFSKELQDIKNDISSLKKKFDESESKKY